MVKKLMVVGATASVLAAVVLCGCLEGSSAREEAPIKSACLDFADLPLEATVMLSEAGTTGGSLDLAKLPRCSEAMQLAHLATSTSLRLVKGQAVRIVINSDAPMYYPGVSDVWKDQAKLSVQVARIEGPAIEGQEVPWGCVHGSRYGYGGHPHVLFHYTGDSDKHIEIVIACPTDESVYKIILVNLDPESNHSVQHKIEAWDTSQQGGTVTEDRLTEKHNVQLAVGMIMMEHDLTVIPHPVADPARATNNMAAFPDAISDWGAAGGKATDPDGSSYRSGDKPGYLLYGHDLVADGAQGSLVNYMPRQTTLFYYTVDPDGTVHQYDRPGGTEYLD